MKITVIKIHHIEWERGPYHWRDGIMPNGPMAKRHCSVARCMAVQLPHSMQPAPFIIPTGIRDASTEIDSEGYARPCDTAGLGIEIDWDWVKKHTIHVEE